MEDEETPAAFFPRTYITELFRLINENTDKVQCITYNDFCWDDDVGYEGGYPDEWRRWQDKKRNGQIDANKIYLVVQYDVDARPERTMDLLREPLHQAIPANIMIFAKRPNRSLLADARRVEYTDYDLDDPLLRYWQSRGSLIGYHFNAFECAGWNAERAQEIFVEDVARLRSRFTIDFCSAHGGVPDTEGRNNNSLYVPDAMRPSLRWVHNKYSPKFNGQFSDGGHLKSKISPNQRDIRDFVKSWRPGGRYRLLIHPQYYDHDFVASPSYSGTPWYDDLISVASEKKSPATPLGYSLSPPDDGGKLSQVKRVAQSSAVVAAPPLASLKNKMLNSAYFILSRLRPLTTMSDFDSHGEGQVLLDVSAGPDSSYWQTAKFNVGVVQSSSRALRFQKAGAAGYVLLGGGYWKGSKSLQFLWRWAGNLLGHTTTIAPPWGGWSTTALCQYKIEVKAEDMVAALHLRLICLSYDANGRLIARKDIGSLSAIQLVASEQFRPSPGAVTFNLALYKSKDEPGGEITIASIKLVQCVLD
jgi:hypothetical protein